MFWNLENAYSTSQVCSAYIYFFSDHPNAKYLKLRQEAWCKKKLGSTNLDTSSSRPVKQQTKRSRTDTTGQVYIWQKFDGNVRCTLENEIIACWMSQSNWNRWIVKFICMYIIIQIRAIYQELEVVINNTVG